LVTINLLIYTVTLLGYILYDGDFLPSYMHFYESAVLISLPWVASTVNDIFRPCELLVVASLGYFQSTSRDLRDY